jgi:hypothetical protein
MKRNIKALLSGDIASAWLDWPDAHDALTGVIGSTTFLTICNTYVPPTSPDYYQDSRGFLSFNTRFLNAKEKATATFKLYLYGYASAVEEDTGQAEMGIVEGIHEAVLVPEDFGYLKAQTASCGWIQAGLWLPNTWNAISITRAFIEAKDITKFGLRLHGDIYTDEPTGVNQIQVACDLAHLPYLEVVYTPSFLGDIHVDQLKLQHVERMAI